MKYIKALTCLVIILLVSAGTAIAGSNVTLAWDANTEPDLAGYKLFWGDATGVYTQSIDVNNVITHTVENLPDGTYYFAVIAYDDSANESGYSNEVNQALEDLAPPASTKNLVITIVIQVGVGN